MNPAEAQRSTPQPAREPPQQEAPVPSPHERTQQCADQESAPASKAHHSSEHTHRFRACALSTPHAQAADTPRSPYSDAMQIAAPAHAYSATGRPASGRRTKSPAPPASPAVDRSELRCYEQTRVARQPSRILWHSRRALSHAKSDPHQPATLKPMPLQPYLKRIIEGHETSPAPTPPSSSRPSSAANPPTSNSPHSSAL